VQKVRSPLSFARARRSWGIVYIRPIVRPTGTAFR